MKDTPMGRADLHCHTYYSDGELSPRAVVEEARRIGLRALAITDHDTMEGLQELTPVPGLEIVPGIERKAYWEGVEIHVLGFDCDWEVLRQNPRVQQDRNDRNRAMIDLLRADGVDVSIEELNAMKKGVTGRPHIAALLVKKGYFPTVGAAFDAWLGEGKPYYVPITWESVPELTAELRSAGGKIVLAHPYEYKLGEERLAELVKFCADSGFHGMEVWYSGYTPAQSAALLALAEKHDLCPTGGSDFHGSRRPDRVIGGAGAPYGLLRALREKE